MLGWRRRGRRAGSHGRARRYGWHYWRDTRLPLLLHAGELVALQLQQATGFLQFGFQLLQAANHCRVGTRGSRSGRLGSGGTGRYQTQPRRSGSGRLGRRRGSHYCRCFYGRSGSGGRTRRRFSTSDIELGRDFTPGISRGNGGHFVGARQAHEGARPQAIDIARECAGVLLEQSDDGLVNLTAFAGAEPARDAQRRVVGRYPV